MSTPMQTSAPATPGPIPRAIAAAIRWALTLRPVRAYLLYSERRGPMLADSITYRALFSVFAGLLLGFSVAGLWLSGNPDAWRALIDAVQSAVPGLIGADGVVDADELRAPVAFSVTGIVSLLALAGAALGAIGSLRTAVRLIAGTAHDDLLWIWVLLRNLLLAVGIGAAFIASALISIAGNVGISWLADILGFDEDAAALGIRGLSLLVVFALDALLLVGVFRLLSGLRVSGRSLWTGALIGGVGLLALQELSALFVGGASNNPLLASFASLLALLIWLNLSAQVMLLTCAYIVTSHEEEQDRVGARFGASTFPQRRVQRAEVDVRIATSELRAAQQALHEADGPDADR
ncbi:YihY/virulence factor BrkB family protein [Microbacterium sp. ZW T5_45]|uniref:YihY/virulence factor BrkB family protein n=1 Tax=Microbacterium sp. ZW T5_45 TaxID=3378080 RepID=UPI0038554CD6